MMQATCVDTHVLYKHDLSHGYFALTLAGYPRAGECRPGQFLHVRLPGSEVFFRRPMSVAGVNGDRGEIDIIFKVLGRGTRLMSALHDGDPVNLLGPLGKPFRPPDDGSTVVMVAGGVGFPPLLFLAEWLVQGGWDPARIEFLYGGRSTGDILCRDRIRALGVRFHPTTEDGSLGRRGLVTEPLEDLIRERGAAGLFVYGCGPEPMLKAVNDLGIARRLRGELSLEAPMPCGIGVRLGCVVPRTNGEHARVCLEGPVFDIGEIAL